MEITEVRVTLRDENKLKAFVSITFDNCFVVRGLKVIEGAKGTFVAMPSRKTNSGEFKDVAHPINSAFREVLQKAVLEAYDRELEMMEAEGRGEQPGSGFRGHASQSP